MPKANKDKAKELYLQGLKLVEIADDLGVPVGTIRSWKSRQKWDDCNNATLQKGKRNVAQRRLALRPGTRTQ